VDAGWKPAHDPECWEMRTYSYYPGCSQISSAEEYGDSAVKAAGALGIRLEART